MLRTRMHHRHGHLDGTQEFGNYNFIYFLVESFDYIAIDENLTPTLYKLWNDSYHFTKHYTPMYSCATGDSEFTSMTGIYPLRSVCTPYEVLNNNLTSSLAGLFKEKSGRRSERQNI